MEIKLSKFKLFLALIAIILILFLGLYTIAFPERVSSFSKSPFLASIIGIGISLMALIYLIIFSQVIIKRTGLIISSEGIIDHSSMVSVGLIRWKDILRIRKFQVNSITFLLIDVNKPEEYLLGLNKLKLWWIKINAKSYGTPISISTVFLNCKFTELENHIKEAHENYLAQQRPEDSSI